MPAGYFAPSRIRFSATTALFETMHALFASVHYHVVVSFGLGKSSYLIFPPQK
jgi:hypothetical protein